MFVLCLCRYRTDRAHLHCFIYFLWACFFLYTCTGFEPFCIPVVLSTPSYSDTPPLPTHPIGETDLAEILFACPPTSCGKRFSAVPMASSCRRFCSAAAGSRCSSSTIHVADDVRIRRGERVDILSDVPLAITAGDALLSSLCGL